MKTIYASILFALLLVSVGCSEEQFNNPANSNNNSGENITAQISSLPMVEITPEIAAGIQYMREEEKVARDVYIALGNLWGSQVFKNISASEQKHMDALKTIIDRYGLTDPVGSNKEGLFTNSDLQKLYNDLVAEGSKSLKDALLVGKLIEEVDIKDIDDRLIAVTSGTDIAYVYQNLKSGSLNHLNAFNNNLSKIQ